MNISEIDMVSPGSVEECLHILANKKDNKSIHFLAGGTDAVVKMKNKIWRPHLCMNIKDISELRYIHEEKNEIHIGPMTTHTDIINSSLLKEKADLLVAAAKEIGAIQLQNLGTIGGNIGTASPAGDTIPPLFVLDAKIELSSSTNRRIVHIEDFFHGPGRTDQKENEMITNIIIRPQQENEIGIFEKLGPRKAQSISIVNCAIHLKMGEGDRECIGGKIAFGSVGPTIVRTPKLEHMLTLGPLTDTIIENIATAAWKEVMPITDSRATAKYRRHMATSLLKRGLYRLIERWEALE